MIPPHASAGSAERYPSAYGLSAAVCQALRAAFIPRRMRCLWAAGLAAALAANPYVLNDGQSLLMSSMGIACSASLLCGTILLCLKYRFTAYVLLPAIILFNAGLYMMQMRYGLVLNLSVLSSMAETNFQEACFWPGLSTWPSTGAAVPCAKKPRGAHWHAFGACTRPFCC